MKLGIFGGSYKMASKPFDCQRTINFYPVVDESKGGKEVGALYGAPGKTLFATVGIGPIRAEFCSTNGRAFIVSATQLFETSSLGAPTLRGTLTSDTGSVTIDENTTQMAICDGAKIYILEYATNTFSTPVIAASPAYTVTQLNQYFIYNTDLGQFYISALGDGTSWNALDFATAESSPDGLVRVFASNGQLVLLGSKSVEFWTDTGDLEFPFDRVQGARMEVGCAAAHSVVGIDNSFIWLGQTKDGQGIVYRAAGYSPQRISDYGVEFAINQSSDLSAIRGLTYQKDGRTFYGLTGGNLETSHYYDVSLPAGIAWHERAQLEADGSYSTDRATTCMFAFGKLLVGDKSNGNIYELSNDVYVDADRELRAERIFTQLFNEGNRIRINQVQVDFEHGVGLVDNSTPLCWLSVSTDGGESWGPELQESIGKFGNRLPRAVWRKMGINEAEVTFKVAVSDPVKRNICGAYGT